MKILGIQIGGSSEEVSDEEDALIDTFEQLNEKVGELCNDNSRAADYVATYNAMVDTENDLAQRGLLLGEDGWVREVEEEPERKKFLGLF